MPAACSEVASRYIELKTLRDNLKRDRQALSEAEAAVNADKHSMEQRAATARHQVQRTMANQVSCMSHDRLDAAAAALSVDTSGSALNAIGLLCIFIQQY